MHGAPPSARDPLLLRLARALGLAPPDRCGRCWGRPAVVAVPMGEPVPGDEDPLRAAPCPACGWQPDVVETLRHAG